MNKIKHILSVIQYTICGAVCFQSTHFRCDDWEYILCLIIIIKSEVWTITHCLGLSHETLVWAVSLSIFLRYDVHLLCKNGYYSTCLYIHPFLTLLRCTYLTVVTVLFMIVFSKARYVCSQVTVLFMVAAAPWSFEMISIFGAVTSAIPRINLSSRRWISTRLW